MDCDMFLKRLESLSETGAAEAGTVEHARSCQGCRQRLARARVVTETLRGLPRARPAELVDSRILAEARRVRPRAAARLLRVAAALVLVAGGGIAVLLLHDSDSSYPRLDLKVVVERGNDVGVEDVFLVEMFGPETPILAANGERRADRR